MVLVSFFNMVERHNPVNGDEKRVGVRYCPGCGHMLEDAQSLLNEYWQGTETVYFCWCFTCSWTGEIVETTHVIASEPAEWVVT
jgi:hypothetical protein